MWRSVTSVRSADGALEATVESARLALACPFSSSEEFEAAIINERRAAGAYGSPFGTWRVAAGIGVIGFLSFAFLFS